MKRFKKTGEGISTMTSQNEVQLLERDTTLTMHQLRSAGYLPITIYGPGVEAPVSAQIRHHEFHVMYTNHGERRFVLNGMGHQLKAKAHQVQMHAAKHKILHVEFYVSAPPQAVS
jgi:ribosomal protein L25 (general stress protein Ctc)